MPMDPRGNVTRKGRTPGASVDIALQGADEIRARLATLRGAVQRQIVESAVSSALSIIAKAAKARCPKDTGMLKASIGVKVKTYSGSGAVWGAVGPRRGGAYDVAGALKFVRKGGKAPHGAEKARINPVRYAHLVEFGHGGPQPAPAHPFLRPALDENREVALGTLRGRVQQGIERVVAKSQGAAAALARPLGVQ